MPWHFWSSFLLLAFRLFGSFCFFGRVLIFYPYGKIVKVWLLDAFGADFTLGAILQQKLCSVSLPEYLQNLSLARFSHSLKHVTLPVSLRKLTLGILYDNRLDNWTLPSSLESLSLAGHYSLKGSKRCDFSEQSHKLDACRQPQTEPARNDLTGESSKLDPWRCIQPILRFCDFATQSAKLDFGQRVQQEPRKCGIARQFAKLDVCGWFQPEPAPRGVTKWSSKFDFRCSVNSHEAFKRWPCRVVSQMIFDFWCQIILYIIHITFYIL